MVYTYMEVAKLLATSRMKTLLFEYGRMQCHASFPSNFLFYILSLVVTNMHRFSYSVSLRIDIAACLSYYNLKYI